MASYPKRLARPRRRLANNIKNGLKEIVIYRGTWNEFMWVRRGTSSGLL
jgi:hypothetical protein